jgi:hypothetical protein
MTAHRAVVAFENGDTGEITYVYGHARNVSWRGDRLSRDASMDYQTTVEWHGRVRYSRTYPRPQDWPDALEPARSAIES